MKDTIENTESPTETKKFLLTDESFKLLQETQQRIKEETDMIPSLRKLLNELITEEAIREVEIKMIEKLG